MSKGCDTLPLMELETAKKQIQELMIKELSWVKPEGNLAVINPEPFDISQPNIHESKTDFLYELKAVSGVVEHTAGIKDLLLPSNEEKTEQHEQLEKRLQLSIDLHSIKLRKSQRPSSSTDLALNNILDVGFYWNSIFVAFYMNWAYSERLKELKEQEREFWSVKHRPPNYYARAIALRLARFYAQQTGTKPTFGTSSDGPHPSTHYARLLEQVFRILEINAALKNAASYAIENITDEDLKPKGLLSALFEKPFSGNDVSKQGLYDYINTITNKSKN